MEENKKFNATNLELLNEFTEAMNTLETLMHKLALSLSVEEQLYSLQVNAKNRHEILQKIKSKIKSQPLATENNWMNMSPHELQRIQQLYMISLRFYAFAAKFENTRIGIVYAKCFSEINWN